MAEERCCLCIDLKSFYASVECAERGLDPLTTHLVVADESRTEKTICLAVTPSLKALGVPGRPRLFEVVQRVQALNESRRAAAPGGVLVGSSHQAPELEKNPSLALDYVVAQPRMAFYMDYSTRIFQIYCRHVSPEDIHVYSIDEVFIELTSYLKTNRTTPREMAMLLIREVLKETHITATAGIGTNLYLAKIAMDIVAKKMPPDQDGVRIAELDELSYRRLLWAHRPLTDFWRIGPGIARKLEQHGMMTLGDVALASLAPSWEKINQQLLWKLFGVNAELLIDHAWGWEPTRISHIKAYQPESNSISSGQVLSKPYPFAKARIIAAEMADGLALDLVDKGVMTDKLSLYVGYEAGEDEDYTGETAVNYYGKTGPKPAHGSVRLPRRTSSARMIREKIDELFCQIVSDKIPVRRINIAAEEVGTTPRQEAPQQLDLFHLEEQLQEVDAEETSRLEKEHRRQEAVLTIKKKYGKNAILMGFSYEEDATARERNQQIGGHRA